MTGIPAAGHPRRLRARSTALGAGVALTLLAAATAPSAQAAAAAGAQGSWQPEAPTYAVSAPVHTTVTTDDGVVLSVEVTYPTDPSTGARAPGTFPVLLTQNPYGTVPVDPTTPGDYFVQRGYIYVAAAVRGTGESGGQLDWFGSRQGRDGAELVDWAAHRLTGSNGSVGLDGCSYLGVDQWYTAAAVGRNSALKAISPFCTDSDMYNDLTADGGIPTPFVAGIAQGEPRGPQDDPSTDPQSVTVLQQMTGGPRAYDNDYWQGLDVQQLMPQIVANGIPAITEAGWNDLFPGGNLGDYVAAQNAYFNRPLTRPITPGESVTGRYQAVVGPWTHGEHVNEPTLQGIRLQWFDTWLKGRNTGMAATPTPLHLFENGADHWVDTAAWPPTTTAGRYYLGAGSSLSPGMPGIPGSGSLSWAPASPTNTLTYTTPPLPGPAVLDGPGDVTVYARSTAPDVELTATLNIVAPDGTVTKQADGVLLGSQRRLNTQLSWYGQGGTLLQPSHPFTRASQQPVTPGRLTRYDISLLSNFTQIPAGYKLQITVNSQPPANFHAPLIPTPQEAANLAAGTYTIEYSPLTPSAINLSLTQQAFATSPVDWGPTS